MYKCRNSIFIKGNEKAMGVSRRVKSHPKEAMDTDEVAIFRRKDDDNCKLTGLYFTVVKKISVDDDFIFYAIAGVPTSSGGILDDIFDELDGGNETHRYENQIAFIFCSWVD